MIVDYDYFQKVEEAKRALKEAEENLKIAEEELYLSHLSSAETRLHKLGYDLQKEVDPTTKHTVYCHDVFVKDKKGIAIDGSITLFEIHYKSVIKELEKSIELDDDEGNTIYIPFSLFDLIHELLKERGLVK